jgi:AraC-like DNA-binding protein
LLLKVHAASRDGRYRVLGDVLRLSPGARAPPASSPPGGRPSRYASAENEMPTAAVQNVRLVVAAALARGVPPGKLFAQAGIEPQSLLDPDGRLPAEVALRAWRAAAELSGDPNFGLSVVDHVRPDTHGGVGYVVHGSATLGEGMRRLSTFFRLLHQRTTLEVVSEGGLARLRFVADYDGPPGELKHPVECMLSVLLSACRRTTGRPLRPLAVSFRHGAPAALDAHRRAFDVEPAFDQPHSELCFAAEVFDLPSAGPDAQMVFAAERHLRQLLEQLPRDEAFATRARGALLEELRRGEPTLERLAARLRVSERTLQRRLSQEGTSLQALLDDLRRELSLRHLAESGESIAEIAFVLGFSEVSAFHRAFKRWTGSTPGAYRQTRGGQAPPVAPAG